MNSEKQVDGYGCISKVHMENPCCGERDTPRSVKTCSIPKMEPKHVEQLICSPKTCSIFGGHDLNPKTEKYVSPHSKKRNKDSNTLGSPIGLVKSSVSAKSDVKGSEIHVQKFATYLKAFAKVYVTPEIEWTTAVLDLLLKEGQQLHAESLKEYTSAEADSLSTVYSEAESKVKRSFEFAGCTFQLELNDKFRLSSMEQGGDELIPDMIVELLKPAFKGFFRHRKYCLLKVSSWYLMIWKARGVWFVLDFYGRRLNDFATDREKGLAMLICLKALDNVCHLLMHLSGIQKSDTFSLRELKVVKLVGLDGKTVNREFGKRTNQYEILSYDYALLRADLHLSLNSAEPLRSRSGLPVAVAALLASKIDHPATWNQKQLNKIICYGVNMCKSVWKQCLSSQNPVPVEKFPLQLKIGQFIVGYSIAVRKHEGTWKCVPNYKNSDLAMAIEQSFQERDNNLILQIANQFYPIWMKNNFIYLLDPYRHRCVGTPPSEPNEEGEGGEATPTDGKSASLRMFRTVDAFLKVFTQILLETNKTTPFYLHRLQVKKLSLAEKAEGVPDVEEAPEDGAEVKSLNETICFEEDEAQCLEELGEISDYEEEDDVTSDVVQLDEKEPASESDDSEEDMEEEEMGMEGLSEYESSSSGDGDGHSRRRKKKGKGKKDEDAKSDKDKKKKKGKDKKEKKDKDKSDKDKKDKTGKKEKKEKPKKEKTEKDKKEKPEKPEKEKKDTKEKKRKSKKEKDTDGESAEDKDNKENKKDNKEDDTSKDDKKRQSKKEKVPEKDKPEVPKKKSIAPPGEKSITNAADGNNKKDSKSNNDDDQNKSDQDKGRAGSGSKFGSTTTKGASSFSQQDERAQKSRGGGSDDDDEDKDDRDSLSCKPNNYPGYSTVAHDMAVVGSESGSYESICKLLRAGFKCADRILTMTPWGNYVVFRGNTVLQKIYFLFDGCTCNVNRFRHLDLNCGTAGLLCFQNLHDVICYILDSHKIRTNLKKSRKNIVDEICKQYCK